MPNCSSSTLPIIQGKKNINARELGNIPILN